MFMAGAVRFGGIQPHAAPDRPARSVRPRRSANGNSAELPAGNHRRSARATDLRLRTRCVCLAVLMRRKKRVKARAAIAHRSTLRPSTSLSKSSSISASASPRRRARDATRSLSTVSNASSPSSRRMTRPRAAANQRTPSWRGRSSGRVSGDRMADKLSRLRNCALVAVLLLAHRPHSTYCSQSPIV